MSPPTSTSSDVTVPRLVRDVLVAAIAVGAVVWLSLFAARHYSKVGDAVALLGAVIPALVSLGAAAVGIPLAYQSGQTKGVEDGSRKTAAALKPMADAVKEQTESVKGAVETTVPSPEGTADYVLEAGETLGSDLSIPASALEGASESATALSVACDALLR